MKPKILGGIFLFCIVSRIASAILVSGFQDTDTLIKWSKDIIIADCVSIPTNETVVINGKKVQVEYMDGIYKVEINVLRTLKGNKQPGKQIILAIYPMTPGKRYLLSSYGGGSDGTDFMAVPQLSVVEIPSTFDLSTLDGRDLKEQIQSLFSASLFILDWKLAPLLEERGLLEKAISDRQYVWFDSAGPVKLGPIIETSTTNQNSISWLSLGDKKMEWSGGMPDKAGYLYFDIPRKFYWEFSFCDATNIEDLADKPLKTKFTGYLMPHTPRGDINSSIVVSVGQIVFARTIEDPNKTFAIQVIKQDKSQSMTARYSIIQK
jgi:hypothetical protein